MSSSYERGKHCATPAIELERQLYRADAEVAALRLMVRSLAAVLDAVPGLAAEDYSLVDEAKKVAGSSTRG